MPIYKNYQHSTINEFQTFQDHLRWIMIPGWFCGLIADRKDLKLAGDSLPSDPSYVTVLSTSIQQINSLLTFSFSET